MQLMVEATFCGRFVFISLWKEHRIKGATISRWVPNRKESFGGTILVSTQLQRQRE